MNNTNKSTYKNSAGGKRRANSPARIVIGIGMFSALAYAVALICNSVIPPVGGFLSLDVKDSIIAIASFVYGPVSAVLISLVSALVEFVTFSTTGWYGLVMNFVSSTVFSLVASLIYKKKRTFGGALIGIYSGVVATTAVMFLMNILVTPWYLVAYMGMPIAVARTTVADMIPVLLLPFNFAKTMLNSAIIVFLYKPLAAALSRMGLGMKSGAKLKWSKKSIISISVATAALAVAMTILLILWL